MNRPLNPVVVASCQVTQLSSGTQNRYQVSFNYLTTTAYGTPRNCGVYPPSPSVPATGFHPAVTSSRIGELISNGQLFTLHERVDVVVDTAAPPAGWPTTIGTPTYVDVNAAMTTSNITGPVSQPSLTPAMIGAVQAGAIPSVDELTGSFAVNGVAEGAWFGLTGWLLRPGTAIASATYSSQIAKLITYLTRLVSIVLIVLAIVTVVRWLWARRPGYLRVNPFRGLGLGAPRAYAPRFNNPRAQSSYGGYNAYNE